MDKLIFLDIDGVLNSYTFLRTGNGFLDPEKIKKLNQLAQYPDVKIVISSSWGYDGGKTEESLKGVGLTIPIVGYTKHLHFKYDWACRGNEIAQYIIENYEDGLTIYGKQGNSNYLYVILDDDEDMLMGQKDNFVHVDGYKGLSDEDLANVLRILELE